MTPEIKKFATWMEDELIKNSSKGDWKDFKDPNMIIAELEWHKAKFLMAARNKNRGEMREYLADCGNILLFMANALNLFSDDNTENN